MSRTRSRRCLSLLGLTVGIALVLTSCFGGDDETEDSTTTTQQSAAPTTAAQPAAPATTATTVVIVEPPTTTVFVPAEEVPVDTLPVPPEPPPPTTTRAPGQPLNYTIQQGDTLYSIARQFGVTVDQLIEINNLTNPDVIYVDDVLTIPPPG